MKLVPVEFLPNCYVVKLVLVEIGYVVPTSNIFFIVRYFPNPKNRTKQGPHVLVKPIAAKIFNQNYGHTIPMQD